MGKPTGSANYSLPEMLHMLDIAKRILPQGKDHWDAVTARYNATRENHWPERDIDSLRRKFKALYGMRKPTGNPNIPAHVRLAKDVKRLIDEASSVFVTSDAEVDNDVEVIDFRVGLSNRSGQLSGEIAEHCIGVGQDNESEADDDEFSKQSSRVLACTDTTEISLTKSPPFDAYHPSGTPPFMRSNEEMPGSGSALAELELELAEASKVVAGTPSLLPSEDVGDREEPALRRSRRNKTNTSSTSRTPLKTGKTGKPSGVTSGSAVTTAAAQREKLRYPDLAETSDRLGGVNLAAMRDASKARTYDEFEEASFTKQKRIKAEKAAADLKRKLARATQISTDSSSELVKTMMILRADADREDRARAEVAEAKRAAERDARDERRREERREERETAEDRRREERREEREAADESRRIDREESRAHMREMMMMLSAIQSPKAPSVDIRCPMIATAGTCLSIQSTTLTSSEIRVDS